MQVGRGLRFDEFVELALYSDQGFYRQFGRAGRRGDFITSSEIGPLFGLVIANYLDSVWNEMGRPRQFDVIEVGAGPGTLARAVFASSLGCRAAIRYFAVEKSEVQRKLHPSWVQSVAEYSGDQLVGVVLANELLDNFPFRLMVFDSCWKESWVIPMQTGFVEELRDISVVPSSLPKVAPHGARAPIQDAARDWVRSTVSSIRQGRLLVFDYARRSTARTSRLPWREWLRTYSNHGRGTNYLKDVGLQDITCDVMLDHVLDGIDAQFMSQASFLELHGIEEAVEEGRTYWEAHASQPDVRAMMMRSRVSEAEALLDPSGLGAFTVAEVVVGS